MNIYAFIQQIFTEHLLCARILVTKNNAVNSTDKFPALIALRLVVVEGDTDKPE